MTFLVPIPERDRRRVVSAAGLLASDKDGEVVAAARAVCRLLKPHGMTVAALIESAMSAAERQPRPNVRDHRRLAQMCLAMSDCLNEWEIGFLHSVKLQFRLSEKQWTKLRSIEAKIDELAR